MLNGEKTDDEILSAGLVLTEEEILAEFHEQCEAAAEQGLLLPEGLQVAAKAVCGMKRRSW